MSDVTAFNNCMSVFWRQHEAELARFLTSKTGDSEKAADLLQELFLRARAHSDSFCEMENPRAWLYSPNRSHASATGCNRSLSPGNGAPDGANA